MDLVTAADERLKAAGDVHERDVKVALSKLESNIITTAKKLECVHNWLREGDSDGELERLYSGSRDGFAGNSFHSKCDGMGCTLTVIETTDGYVLGGYSNTPWSCSFGFKEASKAFLFVLSGSDVASPCILKLNAGKEGCAVYHTSAYGPCFGAGLHLFVYGSKVTLKSSSTYEPWPAGQLSKKDASFTIKEIEVFRRRIIVGVIERENIRSQLPEVIDLTSEDQALSPLAATANNIPSRRVSRSVPASEAATQKLGKRKGGTDAADDRAAKDVGGEAAAKKRKKKEPAPTSNATANATHVADAAGNGRPAGAQGGAPKCTPTEAAADAALKSIQEHLSNGHATELEEELSTSKIIGNKDAKDTLQDLPMCQDGHWVDDDGFEDSESILLIGPPGTGKTLFAKALASHGNANFITISPDVILDEYIGNSEKNMRAYFDVAKRKARESGNTSVMFFDECDRLFGKPGKNDCNVASNIIGIFQECMNGVKEPKGQVVVLAATNYSGRLPGAVRSRFGCKIKVALPGPDERVEITKLNIGKKTKLRSDMEEEDYARLAEETEGASGRDLKNLVKNAMKVQRLSTKNHCRWWHRCEDDAGVFLPCCHALKADCGAEEFSVGDQPAGSKLLPFPLSFAHFAEAIEKYGVTPKDHDEEED